MSVSSEGPSSIDPPEDKKDYDYSLNAYPNITVPAVHAITPQIFNLDISNNIYPSFVPDDEVRYDRRPNSHIDDKLKKVKENKLRMESPLDLSSLSNLVSAKSQRMPHSPTKLDVFIETVAKTEYHVQDDTSPSRSEIVWYCICYT